MSKILVVDDCVDSRRLAGALLQGKVANAEVVYAASAEEALAGIKQSPPDLIVSDVMMSGMSGMELVEHVRKSYPVIPVIVITAFGSEDFAVQALQKGAASYVPKKHLVQRLVPTVENVLDLSRSNRNRQRVIACLNYQKTKYTLENDTSLITPLVGLLQEQLIRCGFGDECERVRLGVGLHESLTNAIQHGNLELNSDLRQEDETIYHDLAAKRRQIEPYASRRVDVMVTETPSEITYAVRDQGPGFKVKQVQDPTEESNLGRIGGRGLLLIRSFFDDVRHSERGNEITMIRRRPGAVWHASQTSHGTRCSDADLDFIDQVTESADLATCSR